MKVAILAGGMGTRLAEETEIRPKPMVEIGGKPILWHIMRHYDHYGFKEFVIALGYKGDHIRRFFTEYHANASNLRIDLSRGFSQPHGIGPEEKWVVELIETGHYTNTSGRIAQLAPYLGNDTFMLTWGDGVSDIDIHRLIDFHQAHGKLATVTAVHPPPRFGQVILDGDLVIIARRERADNGEMVVANVNGEVTLKRLYREGERVRLQPANSLMSPIYAAARDVAVQGVVVGLMRRF